MDFEYTIFLIHEAASRLAKLTEKPEPGLMTWLEAFSREYEKLQKLEITQKAPDGWTPPWRN